MWRVEDLYDQRAIPLGDRSNALTRAYVEMDKVVHGPAYPLHLQHPCARDANIHFVEEGHKYTVTHDGREVPCMSVTTVAHGLFPHFDGEQAASLKIADPRKLVRYEYYPALLDFMADYIYRCVQSGGSSPFTTWRLRQVDGFLKEITRFRYDCDDITNPPAVWPKGRGLLDALHHDTGLPRPEDESGYTRTNLRSFLDHWFKTAPVASRSAGVAEFATTGLRFLWFCNGGVASTLGTYMHENIEFYYNGEPHELVTREAVLFTEFTEELKRTKGLEPYRTEWKVYDEDLRIVGTIDMVYWDGVDDRRLWIYDWKRAKKLLMPDKIYWTKRFGTAPLTAMLEDCNFHHYSMQLNIYKTILERKYGRKVQEMNLVVLHPAQRAPIVQPVYERPTLCHEIAEYRLNMLRNA